MQQLVAEWAGNSVEVLHRTYEKCLVGHNEIAMRRISDVLRPGPREPIGKDQPETADDSRTPVPDPEHEKAQVIAMMAWAFALCGRRYSKPQPSDP